MSEPILYLSNLCNAFWWMIILYVGGRKFGGPDFLFEMEDMILLDFREKNWWFLEGKLTQRSVSF